MEHFLLLLQVLIAAHLLQYRIYVQFHLVNLVS
jgi:hypothetical protein